MVVTLNPLNLYYPSQGWEALDIVNNTAPLNLTTTKYLMDFVRISLSSLFIPSTDTSLFYSSVIGNNLSSFSMSYDGKERKVGKRS